MQKNISTNLHLPISLWKEVKIYAAQHGKTMREVIIEGIEKVLKKKSPSIRKTSDNLLLKYAGKAKSNITNGSTQHDRYLEP